MPRSTVIMDRNRLLLKWRLPVVVPVFYLLVLCGMILLQSHVVNALITPRPTLLSAPHLQRILRRSSTLVSPSSSSLKAAEEATVSTGALQPPAISIEGLSCTHNGGETWQFQDVSYVLARGSRVALIGRNGTGKSSLLNILAETCREQGSFQDTNYKYTGKVTKSRDVRVAHVQQEPPMPSDVTVGDAILGITTNTDQELLDTSASSSRNVFNVVRRYRLAVQTAETNPDEFTAASAAMDARNGWGVLTKADEISTKLRVYHLQDQPLSQLSGGERKRVALCAALVEEPDVLLLDEPTNFLSLAGVQWLADLLTQATSSQQQLTILMVTHDRAFLEDVADRILELDRGQLYEHVGSYSKYVESKADRLANEDAQYQSSKAKLKVELEWMRRQPQARATKSKARIDAFYKLDKATKPRPLDPNLALDMSGKDRFLGGKIVSMRGVSLKFGDKVMLDDFSYDFCSGDRICFAGANGIGKTTFTKLITGEQAPDAGEIELGETVVLGVYDQLGLKFDASTEHQTVMEFVVNQVRSGDSNTMAEHPEEARRLLKQFEFPRSRWQERVSVLSGGERRRLQMLSVLSAKPNVLLLDEPSVDCDLDTLAALEGFLLDFKGVLIIVSHDRAFADKVTDHLFVFEGSGVVKDFQGSLSEYASCLVELENDKIQNQLAAGGAAPSSEATAGKAAQSKEDKAKRNEVRNFVRQAKKDMLNLERATEKLKQKAEDLQSEIDKTSSDEGWTVLAELTDKINGLNEEIDEKETRWMELAEELEEVEVEL
jgi:ATP-binding cassette subfamily F protein uup